MDQHRSLCHLIHVKLLKKEVIPGPVLPLGGFWKEEEGLGEARGALMPGCIGQGCVYAWLIGMPGCYELCQYFFLHGPLRP